MIPSIHLAELNNVCECAETGEVWDLNFFIIIFILLASPKKKKNKQTNKQKERWQGHRNSCGQLQRARILIKKIKTRNIKKHSDTRKTTATYNKLLDETRDEHYYILQGRSQDFSKGGSQTGTPSGDRRLYMVYTAALPRVSAGSVVLLRHEGPY